MKRLKKITLKLPLDPRYKEILDLLDKFEVTQVHRYTEDYIVATIKIRFKDPNMGPKDLKEINELTEVIVEDTQKNEYICITKHLWHPDIQLFYKNPEILIEPPLIMENESLIVSYICESSYVDYIIETLEKLYNDNFKILSITLIHPNKDQLPYLLTERQKEIAYFAVENGYYEIPRKISIAELAKHFEVSTTALAEHLRKVEKIVFNITFK